VTTLWTASFQSFRSGLGQPVSIALALPRWRDDCQNWPACHLLTPRWAYFNAPAEEFDAEYVSQLQRFGVPRIRAVLERIAVEHEADRLVLICHEADREQCHRGTLARSWQQEAGQEMPEAGGAEPMHDVPAGTVVQVQFSDGGKTYTFDCPDPVGAGDFILTSRGVRAQVVAVGSEYPGPFATARRIST
jgi:hypothetical protein